MTRKPLTGKSPHSLRRLVVAPLAVATFVATGAAALLSTDAAGAAVIVSGNLVKDPDFVNGSAAWTAPAGASLSIVAGHNGHKAIAETNSSGAALTANVNDKTNTVASTVKGATYTASAWISVSVPKVSVAVREGEWRGRALQGPTASGTAWLTSTAWRFVSVDYVAVTNGASIDLNYLAYRLPSRASLYISEPSLIAKVPGASSQVTITPANQAVTYGGKDPAFTYAVSGLPGGDTLTTAPTCGVAGSHTAAGSYPITCSGAIGGSNYTVVYATGTLTVSPAQVTLTPANQTVGYGSGDPAFGYTVTGLQGADTLTSAPTCGVAGVHTAAGSYPINCSGAAAGSNYTVAYGTGTLTVARTSVTVTPANQTVGYGSSDPTFGYAVTGLQGNDALVTAPTCGVAAPHRAAGTYPITCSGAAAGGNYTVAYGTGTLTVLPAHLIVIPVDQGVAYGADDPAFTYAVSGLQGSDVLTAAPACGVAGPHAAVGTYPITCADAGAGSNYTVDYRTGTLTVARASVTVTPVNQTVVYGAGDPAFAFTVTGLQGSDTLGTAPTCGVVGSHSAAGRYPITCSGTDAGGNYAVVYRTGTLTVSPAQLTVMPNNQAIGYGTGDPLFSYTTAGLVPGDSLTTQATCLVAGQHATAGTYPITCSGADAGGNYAVVYRTGTLTVSPAQLTVTPANQTIVYGSSDPTFTYAVSGLQGSDVLTAAPTCAVSGGHAAAGSYPINCSGAGAGGNYTAAYGAGTFTVMRAQLTVTPDDQRMTAGASDPTFTYTLSGLKGADTLTTVATCGVAGVHTTAGTYPITCSGAGAGGNYTVAYGTGTLTVSPATQPATVTSPSSVYKKLTFDDEFDGTALDTSKWNVNQYQLPYEMSESLASNVSVRNSDLVIPAIRETSPHGRPWTSAYVDTRHGKFAQKYGRFEARIKINTTADNSSGLWPAFWLRPDNTAYTGEIDIMEAWGEKSNGYATQVYPAGGAFTSFLADTMHTDNRKQSIALRPASGTRLSDGFHTYALEWTPTTMAVYLDNVQVGPTLNPTSMPWWNNYDTPFHIRLQMQVGQLKNSYPDLTPGYWGTPTSSTIGRSEMLVDWVRVWGQ